MSNDDFAFEPIPGLPAKLPRGEQILWQCRPDWKSLAWRGMFVRPVAIYFGLIMGWRVVEALQQGGSVLAALAYALDVAPVAAAALGLLVFLAWAYSRSTIYTVTSQRVVIRSGVALPMTVNLPFKIINSAALRLRADGMGDLPLEIAKSERVYSLALWPHLRPWNFFSKPQPMLRGIAQAERVAGILSAALQASLKSDAEDVAQPSLPERVGPVVSAARERGNEGLPQGLADSLQGATS